MRGPSGKKPRVPERDTFGSRMVNKVLNKGQEDDDDKKLSADFFARMMGSAGRSTTPSAGRSTTPSAGRSTTPSAGRSPTPSAGRSTMPRALASNAQSTPHPNSDENRPALVDENSPSPKSGGENMRVQRPPSYFIMAKPVIGPKKSSGVDVRKPAGIDVRKPSVIDLGNPFSLTNSRKRSPSPEASSPKRKILMGSGGTPFSSNRIRVNYANSSSRRPGSNYSFNGNPTQLLETTPASKKPLERIDNDYDFFSHRGDRVLKREDPLPVVATSTSEVPGFPNDAFHCYRNAALQAVLVIDPFVQDVCRIQRSLSSGNSGGFNLQEVPKWDVFYDIVNLISARNSRSQRKINEALSALNSSVIKMQRTERSVKESSFDVDKMNDPNEYLVLLFNALSEVAVKGRGQKALTPNGEGGSSDEKKTEGASKSVEPLALPEAPGSEADGAYDPVLRNFQYSVDTTHRCLTCSRISLKPGPLQTDFYLSFQKVMEWEMHGNHTPRRLSLRDCFEAALDEAVVEKGCDDPQCSGKKSKMTQKMVVLPRVLLVGLKRYDYSRERPKKNCTKVLIPKCISVENHIDHENAVLPTWEPEAMSDPAPEKSVPVPQEADDSEMTDIADEGFPIPPESDVDPLAIETKTPEVIELDTTNEYDPDPDLHRAIELSLMDHDAEFQEALRRSMDPTQQGFGDEIGSFLEDGGENDLLQEGEELTGNRALHYRLVGVISHVGTRLDTGHYTADVCRVGDKTWYHCNDMSVTKINEKDVLTGTNTTQGYIFLYMNAKIYDKVVEASKEVKPAPNVEEKPTVSTFNTAPQKPAPTSKRALFTQNGWSSDEPEEPFALNPAHQLEFAATIHA